ncbi:MAG: DUF4932 domain-containing protein [Phycisphaerales bacterium]|nr:MAG: DUF4932 domain-containing protein [Phycisphaerales bacterium]
MNHKGASEKLWLTLVLWLSAPIVSFAGRADSPKEPNSASAKPAGGAAAVPVDIRVDARVELVSVIFRLAGNREYNRCCMPGYVMDISRHFGPHRDHPVVKLAADLRKKHGVSFDAPMSLAVHLTDANSLAERVPFEPRPPGLDRRWRPQDAREFLEKARDFVKDANFAGFVKTHKGMYDRSAAGLRDLIEREGRLDWFGDFFGARPKTTFHIAIGVVNGPGNYGPHIKLPDTTEFYCILGASKAGTFGMGEPVFDKSMLPTVVHEFCHSYTNPLVDAHASELQQSADRLFEHVGRRMKRMAYSNARTMMREAMVRACVVRYMHATKGVDAGAEQTEREIKRGFLWTGELADLLARYESQRQKYPTLDDFFGEVISFFDGYKLPGDDGPASEPPPAGD